MKGRYVAEPLNELTRYDVPSTSSTQTSLGEPVIASSETRSSKSESNAQVQKKKAIIHKNPKQVAEQKHQRNLRYKKNLSERKLFWRSKNPHYVRYEKTNKSQGEPRADRKEGFGP